MQTVLACLFCFLAISHHNVVLWHAACPWLYSLHHLNAHVKGALVAQSTNQFSRISVCPIQCMIYSSWQAESRPVACFGYHIPPSVLVRLWSVVEVGNPRSERCRKILDVTMSLLSAVAVACSRVTSQEHADLYLKNMHSYLIGLKGLFPEYSFRPNHHMAVHLYDYLLLYGPVHSWWTFPFERLIGIVQRISTNYKIGRFLSLSF